MPNNMPFEFSKVALAIELCILRQDNLTLSEIEGAFCKLTGASKIPVEELGYPSLCDLVKDIHNIEEDANHNYFLQNEQLCFHTILRLFEKLDKGSIFDENKYTKAALKSCILLGENGVTKDELLYFYVKFMKHDINFYNMDLDSITNLLYFMDGINLKWNGFWVSYDFEKNISVTISKLLDALDSDDQSNYSIMNEEIYNMSDLSDEEIEEDCVTQIIKTCLKLKQEGNVSARENAPCFSSWGINFQDFVKSDNEINSHKEEKIQRSNKKIDVGQKRKSVESTKENIYAEKKIKLEDDAGIGLHEESDKCLDKFKSPSPGHEDMLESSTSHNLDVTFLSDNSCGSDLEDYQLVKMDNSWEDSGVDMSKISEEWEVESSSSSCENTPVVVENFCQKWSSLSYETNNPNQILDKIAIALEDDNWMDLISDFVSLINELNIDKFTKDYVTTNKLLLNVSSSCLYKIICVKNDPEKLKKKTFLNKCQKLLTRTFSIV